MTPKLTIEFETWADLAEFVTRTQGTPVAVPEAPQAKPKPKAKAKPKEKAKPTPAAPQAAPAAPAAPPEMSLPDLTDRLRAIVVKMGDNGTALAELLQSQYGVAKLSELSPEHYGAYLRACEERAA